MQTTENKCRVDWTNHTQGWEENLVQVMTWSNFFQQKYASYTKQQHTDQYLPFLNYSHGQEVKVY